MKKILMMFREDRKIDTYPYVFNFIKMMNSKYSIDFLVTNDMYKECNVENLNLIPIKNKKYPVKCIKYILTHGKDYELVVTFGIEGIWALFYYNFLNPSKRLPGIYFSMELFDCVKKLSRVYRILWKLFGGSVKRDLKFSVIQDEKRAEILREDLNFVDKVYLLPNSYIGCTNETSNWAYKEYSIEENKKILFYSGALESWAFDIDMSKYLAPLFDKNFILFLSGFSRDGYVEEIKAEYKNLIAAGKVIINEKTLDENEYTKLVKSAYIGLPWYTKIDVLNLKDPFVRNVYYIGLSSGKLCKYLSCSIPVVLPEFYYGYKELIQNNNFGKTSAYSVELSEKILEIDSNYKIYKANAEIFYKNEIEYSKCAQVIVNKIHELID